ncbi:hypothetical protein RDI61_24145 [Pseudomonas plecoglossicida]|uniref:Bacterial Ig domain-containing protein n=1 Tax=Pseudomonas putida TaxID=303 RepID=A0A7V8ECB6_PSEPU|nr:MULTISPECIES: hypothetical protein [Pseudomonas]KAF0251997.1 hypothetical protein GN299_25490 [Pseudomonas putida]MCK2124685.1 hypothetical protein [Pseudomonas sp. PNPG3]MDQ7967104.1 hypothetical protein [Pseudomonas plecoglossicida]WFG05304.1 hypothetical protein P3X84_11960 [Pseudomonas putida]
MNILGRNLLSLTVYHLRRAIRIVIGSPVVDGIVVNPDGSVAVGGSGGTPGQTIVITFPDGSVGTGIVGNGGGWTVTSPGVVTPVPGAPDLIVDQVPTPETPVTPEPGEVKPGEGGGTVVGGGGANPGDDVEVTLPGGETGSGGADDNGEWEVEFPDVPHDPDVGPGDVGVVTNPKPGEPVVGDVTPNQDGTVTVGGGGAKPGDQVTVTFPDGSTGTGTADDNGDWSVVSPGEQDPGLSPGDVTVDAKPNPMAGSVSAPDAIYADIAGFEFVEVDDNGSYLAWEQFVEQLNRVIGINTTPTSSISFSDNYGYPKRVLKSGNTYIAAFDSQYVIFESENQINQGTARVVAKNYITARACDIFKTEHATYYLRNDNGIDRLTRLDGSDTSIALDIAGVFGDQKLPAMTSLGEDDWLVNSDFSISYLINPASLSVRPGPVFSDLTLQIEGLGAEISSTNGRVFVSATHMGDQGTAIFELTLDGYSLVSQGGGNIVAGGEYIYAISNSVLRAINLSSGLERTTSLDSAVSIGYARGDFAVFLNNDVSLTVTYDAGETFEKVFPIEGDSSLKWLDVEDTNLVLTRNFREFDLIEYMLIEE